MIEVHRLIVGPALENTYCLIQLDTPNREALIIDPGAEAERVIQWIDQLACQPIAVLLTHTHFDHIGALDAVRDAFDIEAYVYYIEASYIANPVKNLSTLFLGESNPIVQRSAEHKWQTLGKKQIGSFQFDVMHVPGHSPGSVAFLFEEEHVLIAGDALFKESIGRTDLPEGNSMQLIQSIQTQLLTLCDDTTVYPGHGEQTTLYYEKQFNLFLN